MRPSLMSKNKNVLGGRGRARHKRPETETSAIEPVSPERREAPEAIVPPRRPAKWPLAMISLGVLLTVAWAVLLLWLAVTFLGDVFMPPGEDPVEELLRRSAPPRQPS